MIEIRREQKRVERVCVRERERNRESYRQWPRSFYCRYAAVRKRQNERKREEQNRVKERQTDKNTWLWRKGKGEEKQR